MVFTCLNVEKKDAETMPASLAFTQVEVCRLAGGKLLSITDSWLEVQMSQRWTWLSIVVLDFRAVRDDRSRRGGNDDRVKAGVRR